MPKLPDLIGGFKILKEVDLNAVRLQAETPQYVMVVGEIEADKIALVEHLLTGPKPEDHPGLRTVTMHRPDPTLYVPDNTLVLLLLGSGKADYTNERGLFNRLIARQIAVVVCYTTTAISDNEIAAVDRSVWAGAETAVITTNSHDSLMCELVPAILRVCKGREVRLARHLPIMRRPVAQKLIDDTCFINTTYSLSTGLAEIVPWLDLPLNLADIIILSKNQAMMAYIITLAMGMKAEWRDTIPKLTAVVGSAFLWRQLARYLAGLIPVIGIIPKVVIAYSGTYVIGETIYSWCANGEKLNPQELKLLYAEALERGGVAARALISGRGAITRGQASSRLYSAISSIAVKSQGTRRQIVSAVDKMIKPPIVCPACGKPTLKDASFCGFCGKLLNS